MKINEKTRVNPLNILIIMYIFSGNSEAEASELPENVEEMFPRY